MKPIQTIPLMFPHKYQKYQKYQEIAAKINQLAFNFLSEKISEQPRNRTAKWT